MGKNRTAAILIGAVLSVPAVAIFAWLYLRHTIEAEWAAGARS